MPVKEDKTTSIFHDVELLPNDPILGLSISFREDPRKTKVNLGVGSYKDSEGHPMVLTTVEKAEKIILDQRLNKEYLPIQGGAQYVEEALKLIYGEECSALKEGRIFGAQTIGGSGALRIGGELLAQEINTSISLSDPSWPNHKGIFTRAGLEIHSYPYYDTITNSFDFKGMCNGIQSMSPKSIILFHGCCHNPTGMDPSFEQWKELSELIQQHKLIPFFDLAYQGFDIDPETDARPIRYFVEQGHEVIVASSFSKNFGLYGERAGLLSLVTKDPDTTTRVGSQIKRIIRGNYSTPPLQCERIISTILSSPELKKEWMHELSNIRERIKEMRKGLVAGLLARGKDAEFDFIHQQTGMFSYSGLTPDQVHRLRQDYGIYMTQSGRINIAGLNWNNLDYVINAMVAVHES